MSSINLNTNTQTIEELVAMGLTNYYTSHPLCYQRASLLRDAVNYELIIIKK
tara:strand:+ start:206 stop:361 length:156 start_codon:yes stop_codon:yes gene_type:complete